MTVGRRGAVHGPHSNSWEERGCPGLGGGGGEGLRADSDSWEERGCN